MKKILIFTILCVSILQGCATIAPTVHPTSEKLVENIAPYNQITIIFNDKFTSKLTNHITDSTKKYLSKKVVKEYLSYTKLNIVNGLQERSNDKGIVIQFSQPYSDTKIAKEAGVLIVDTEFYGLNYEATYDRKKKPDPTTTQA